MFDRFLNNVLNPREENRHPLHHKKQEKLIFPNLFQNHKENKINNYLTVSIWDTTSTKDMFDYDNKKTIKAKDYKISHEGYDVYLSNDAQCKSYIVSQGVYNSNTYCGRIEQIDRSIFYCAGGHIENYKVVPDAIPQQLSLSTVIKIGRMKFNVKSLYNGKHLKQHKQHQSQKVNKKYSQCKGTCKFCLCEDTEEDVLISPCGCKGSCAEVHISCLKTWLQNKVTRKSTTYVDFINYDNFNCQICKQDIPITFQVGQKKYSILEERTELDHPFIILEGLKTNKNKTQLKLKFPESKRVISIGRGHESDVKLDDVSISRKHCFIQKTVYGFEIFDNNSKFGTLLQLQPGEKVDLMKQKVQIGRMVLEAVQKEWKRNNQNLKI